MFFSAPPWEYWYSERTTQYNTIFIQEIENKTKSLSKGEILRLSLYKRFPKIKEKKN